MGMSDHKDTPMSGMYDKKSNGLIQQTLRRGDDMNLRSEHIIKMCEEKGYDVLESTTQITVSTKEPGDFVCLRKMGTCATPFCASTRRFKERILELL
jgi:hypothetical protein